MSRDGRRYATPEEAYLNRTVEEGDCLIWTGARNDQGYGQIRSGGRAEYVHRWAYEHFVGPIPEGMVIDHECNTLLCVRPAHLRPMSNSENILRATRTERCKRGHLRSEHAWWRKGTLGTMILGGCRECARTLARESSRR